MAGSSLRRARLINRKTSLGKAHIDALVDPQAGFEPMHEWLTMPPNWRSLICGTVGCRAGLGIYFVAPSLWSNSAIRSAAGLSAASLPELAAPFDVVVVGFSAVPWGASTPRGV